MPPWLPRGLVAWSARPPQVEGLDEDEIARRMWRAGCCGLPFIWLSCAFMFRRHIFLPPRHSDAFDVERLKREDLSYWVRRCALGAGVAIPCMFVWAVLFQLKKDDWDLDWLTCRYPWPEKRWKLEF